MKILSILSLTLTFTISFAQNEIYGPYKNWKFGGLTLTFENDGSVTSSQTSPFNNSLSYESSATVSDENGNFLFYTNGRSVYDENLNYIPGGNNTLKAGNEGISPWSSSVQGSMIVKHPESDLYYIFTVGDALSYHVDGIQYATVDMSANDGAGQVSSSVKIGETVSEALTAGIHSNGRDIWVVTHINTVNGPRIGSFLLTKDSITSNPIISEIDTVAALITDYSLTRHTMQFNNSGTKLISFSPWLYPNRNVGGYNFFDFDNSTGLITRKRNLMDVYSIDSFPTEVYGYTPIYPHVCFSPDEKYLYFKSIYNLLRCDISDWENLNTIAKSFKTINLRSYGEDFSFPTVAGIKFGPNNRLYAINSDEIIEFSAAWDSENLSNVYKSNEYPLYASIGVPNMFIPQMNFSVATEKKLKNEPLSVFPNPFNDSFTINTQEKNYSGTVINSLGQPVLQFEYPAKQINTSKLESGIYYVQFQSHKDSYTLPIVKR